MAVFCMPAKRAGCVRGEEEVGVGEVRDSQKKLWLVERELTGSLALQALVVCVEEALVALALERPLHVLTLLGAAVAPWGTLIHICSGTRIHVTVLT